MTGEQQHQGRAGQYEQSRADPLWDIDPGIAGLQPRASPADDHQADGGGEDDPPAPGRIGDDDQAEEIAVNGVGRLSGQDGRERQGAGGAERLIAHLLHRALIEGRDGGAGRMIIELPADEGVVQAGEPVRPRDTEIGVVGQKLVNIGGQGVGVGRCGRAPEQVNQRAVAGSGLEHGRPPAAAA